MHDALGMGFVQRVGNLDRHLENAGLGERPLSDELAQRLSVDILHRDVTNAAIFADIVDVRDVGMGQ